MYPEIKDPSAFLWEVSWRHAGWFGILGKLWTLWGEQAICLCKNVSVCADESFSSSIFQGSLLDLGLFFQQNYDKVSLIASLGCNMERAKLGERIRKHITAKRHSCIAVSSSLSLSVTVSSRDWWCFFLSWKEQPTAVVAAPLVLSVMETPIMSHGGDRGDWGWHPAGLGNDRVGLLKQTMACPSRKFGCCAVTSAVLNSRDSFSVCFRGAAAVTDGAINQGCFKHSYSTMYSSHNPLRRLSDPRKCSERIYGYYSQLFTIKEKYLNPKPNLCLRWFYRHHHMAELHFASLSSAFFLLLIFFSFLKVAGINCSINCLLVCSGDQQKFHFFTEVIFLERQSGAVACKFEDTLGVVL